MPYKSRKKQLRYWRRYSKRYYRELRHRVVKNLKKRDGPGCVVCGSRRNLEIHHKKDLPDKVAKNGRRHTWKNINQLELMCQSCHRQHHGDRGYSSDAGYRRESATERRLRKERQERAEKARRERMRELEEARKSSGR